MAEGVSGEWNGSGHQKLFFVSAYTHDGKTFLGSGFTVGSPISNHHRRLY